MSTAAAMGRQGAPVTSLDGTAVLEGAGPLESMSVATPGAAASSSTARVTSRRRRLCRRRRRRHRRRRRRRP